MRVVTELKERGYTRLAADELGIGFDPAPHLAAIQAEFAGLEPDPYGRADNRYRRYARGVLLPWSGHFEWIPPRIDGHGREITEYFQGKFNPEFENVRRAVPAISREVRNGPLITHLIGEHSRHIFLDDRHAAAPLSVGLSFIKTAVPGGSERAVATPDYLHQDGELFTFAHLITRRNARGGVNTIAAPTAAGRHPAAVAACDIVAAFELETPLETYAIFDPLISHHVSEITALDPARPAERSVMLIDFTPMVPEHHQ